MSAQPRSAPAQPDQHLTLFDFTDEEFLAVMADHADHAGWVSTSMLADAVKLDNKYPNRNIGIRLGWYKRYGIVERDQREGSPTKGQWRLTRQGEAVVNAALSRGQKAALDNMGTEQMWHFTQAITNRYVRANDASANLVRRQFRVGEHRRKLRA